MTRFHIFQIFYDAATKAALEPGFIPLDNTANPRPEWYEFWVMRQYLHTHAMNAADWYGFVSTKFRYKTGLDAQHLHRLLEQHHEEGDVLLCSPAWDQIAFFQNAFEQGEFWHPGLIEATQGFLAFMGDPRDITLQIGHGLNTVFSNFVIARPPYWRRWLELADALYAFIEGDSADNALARASVSYGSAQHQAPMRAFLQERLACLVLQEGGYRVLAADTSRNVPVFDVLFQDQPSTYELLRLCESAKRQFHATGTAEWWVRYQSLRQQVPLAQGVF